MGLNAYAGIKGSKHDLGSGGTAQATSSNTTEVCVFCHTPHGANNPTDSDGNVQGAPLWNKSLPSSTYTRYSSLKTSTLDGTEAAVGSVSLACLSCHDGSQAMDVMINRPGSGLYSAGGAEFDSGAIGAMTGSPLPNLGTDLSNDHPISIQYAGGGLSYSGGSFGGTKKDSDFATPKTDAVNGNPIWYVDANTSNTRDKNDMILYTRTVGGTTQPYVECASCHDPHNETTAGTSSVAFLRTSNANSAVCLACHNK
ncbi:MAG: cytochrome c3 family protein [Magnetococcales bacterium]|nr:hypothetical protein [Magnetococcales bacterium]NGZ28385.1 cytochrome c3 family protein [Magnetococcales bacterium]